MFPFGPNPGERAGDILLDGYLIEGHVFDYVCRDMGNYSRKVGKLCGLVASALLDGYLMSAGRPERDSFIMNALSLCDRIRGEFDDLFVCDIQGARVRTTTPYLYPDGDYIDLFCTTQGDMTTVSDLGETTRWLRMQTTGLKRSPRQRVLIEDVCLTHGVEFYRGISPAGLPLLAPR